MLAWLFQCNLALLCESSTGTYLHGIQLVMQPMSESCLNLKFGYTRNAMKVIGEKESWIHIRVAFAGGKIQAQQEGDGKIVWLSLVIRTGKFQRSPIRLYCSIHANKSPFLPPSAYAAGLKLSTDWVFWQQPHTKGVIWLGPNSALLGVQLRPKKPMLEREINAHTQKLRAVC